MRQYLAFVERAKQMNLELAAEYLVMAAWLAYLKSRLLLPREDEGPDPTAEEATKEEEEPDQEEQPGEAEEDPDQEEQPEATKEEQEAPEEAEEGEAAGILP